MDEDDEGIYDFAPLPPFDLQRESEETRRTGALHLLRINDNDQGRSQKKPMTEAMSMEDL